MKFGSLIDRDFILVGGSFKTLDSAVEALVDAMAKKKKFPADKSTVMDAVRNREELGGTVLPSGLAIPHGRLEGFQDLLVGLWVPAAPMETAQGRVKMMLFALTSKSGTALYLPMLAAVSKFSQDEEAVDRLLAARDRNAVHHIIGEISLKQEITVEDIMVSDPITCRPDTTLADLADIFYQKNLSFVPVVGDSGELSGEVTVKDLLSRGIPDYVRQLANTRFLKSLEPFDVLLAEEDKITVAEIMRKSSRSVAPDASVIEAATLITGKGYRHLPVVKNGKVVGIVSEMDILKKVIRG